MPKRHFGYIRSQHQHRKMKQNFLLIAIALIVASCGQNTDSLLVISKENGIDTFYKSDNKGNLSPLLSRKQKVAYPILSPDKSQIAFMSEDSGNWNIHLYNLETNTETQSASGPSIESFPAWSPDASKIAYMADRENNRDIYISNPDGSDEKRITRAETIDSEPIWSPSGKPRIYFKSLRKGYEGVYYRIIDQDSTYEVAPAGGANQFLRSVPGMPEISYVHNSAKQNNFMVYTEETDQNYSLLTTDKRITGYSWANSAKKIAISIQGQVEIYTYSDDAGLSLDFIIPHAAYPVWSISEGLLYYNKRIDGVLQVFEYAMQKGTEKQITHGADDSTDAISY